MLNDIVSVQSTQPPATFHMVAALWFLNQDNEFAYTPFSPGVLFVSSAPCAEWSDKKDNQNVTVKLFPAYLSGAKVWILEYTSLVANFVFHEIIPETEGNVLFCEHS